MTSAHLVRENLGGPLVGGDGCGAGDARHRHQHRQPALTLGAGLVGIDGREEVRQPSGLDDVLVETPDSLRRRRAGGQDVLCLALDPFVDPAVSTVLMIPSAPYS